MGNWSRICVYTLEVVVTLLCPTACAMYSVEIPSKCIISTYCPLRSCTLQYLGSYPLALNNVSKRLSTLLFCFYTLFVYIVYQHILVKFKDWNTTSDHCVGFVSIQINKIFRQKLSHLLTLSSPKIIILSVNNQSAR